MVAYDETGSRMPGDPPKGKNVEVRAMGLPGDRPGEAAGLLARCFHNNPNFVDLFPDQRARSRALTRVFAAGLRDALGFGYVYVATRGVESSTGGELVGVDPTARGLGIGLIRSGRVRRGSAQVGTGP